MKQKNPKSHRSTAANDRRTLKVIETYEGKCALLATWESEPDEVQIKNHDYLIELRRTVRNVKNYLLHRASAKVKL